MDVDFDAGFIIKATWHKMRPHFIAEEDQVGYCERISKQQIHLHNFTHCKLYSVQRYKNYPDSGKFSIDLFIHSR